VSAHAGPEPEAPNEAGLHMAGLVEYPTRRAFLDMIGSVEYQAIAHLRTEALGKGEPHPMDVLPEGDVETLGLEKRTDIPFEDGYRWVEVAPAGGETTIALAPPPEGRETGNRETGIGLQTA
jgi:hypothetical protein